MRAPRVFISYAQNDDPRVVLEPLLKDLRFLELRGELECVYDQRLPIGSYPYGEISDWIETSDATIAVVSKEYLSSRFVVEHEIPLLTRRKDADPDYRVFPLIVDVCRWDSVDIFRSSTRCPNGKTTFAELDPKERERHLTSAVNDVAAYLAGRALRGRSSLRGGSFAMIGRERERELATLKLAEFPMLVLYGPPGQGKTEVARSVAATLLDEFPDGVIDLDLQNETHAQNVLAMLSDRMALPAGADPLEAIARRKALLLLDSFEELAAKASQGELEALLKSLHSSLTRASSRAIITSQVEFNRTGLCSVPIGGLGEDHSAQLFHSASEGRYEDFPAAALGSFLVEDLSGHPYSIIVLGRYSRDLDLTLDELRRVWQEKWEEIGSFQPYLDRNALTTAFELTYSSLGTNSQELFLAFGAIPDGLSRQQINDVWGFAADHLNDSLRRLAQRGLLDERARARHLFRLLGPACRYVGVKLARMRTGRIEGTDATVYLRALDRYYESFVRDHAPEEIAPRPASQNQLLKRNFHNIHAALDRQLIPVEDESALAAGETVLRLYWAYHNNITGTRDSLSASDDAVAYIEKARTVFEANGRSAEVVRCLHYTGIILWLRGQVREAEKYLNDALASPDATEEIKRDCRRAFAHMAYREGSLTRAAELYHEIADDARQAGDQNTEIRTEIGLIDCYRKIGDHSAAAEAFERIRDRLDGVTPNVKGSAIRGLAYVKLVEGHVAEAEHLYHDAISCLAPVSDFGTAHCRRGLGDVYTSQRRFDEAEREYARSIELYDLANKNPSLGVALVLLGRGKLASARGDQEAALAAFNEAAEMLDKPGRHEPFDYAVARELQGDVYLQTGRVALAKGQYELALAYFTRIDALGGRERVAKRLAAMRNTK